MKRVLVVDDHEENLYLLQALLESQGYVVQPARNGAEALEAAHRQPPDLIVSDILMPVMDGFALCRAWKTDERLASVPFIFYTATYTDPRDEQLALDLGADAFIVKPAEPDAFLAAVLAALSRAETGRLDSSARPDREEDNTTKQYSEVLVRKLEQKMLELERVNRELEHEIDERRQAEESLRLIRFSVDHVADSVFWTDSAGRVVYASDSTCRSLGYRQEEFLELTLFEIDPTLTAEGWVETWNQLKHEGSDAFETVHKTKDGSIFPVDVSVTYVAFEDRELNCVVARDITERRKTETALRRQLAVDELVKDLLSHIVSASAAELDASIEVILQRIAAFMDVESVIVFQVADDLKTWGATYSWAAPGLRSMAETLRSVPMGTLPWTERELLAGRTVSLTSVDDLPPRATGLRAIWEQQNLKSGLMVPLRGSGSLVKGCLALFSVAHQLKWEHQDVRQAEQLGETLAGALVRKQIEESLRASDERLRQAQKMEAIGQLAGGIAHDFNNLLTAILGYSDLILAGDGLVLKSEAGLDAVQEIRKAAQRAAELTGQILAFSRRQALRPEVVSLNEVIGEMRPLLERTLGEDVDVKFKLDPELGRCEVDPHQLVSVLMNLAVNARDAMPQGGRLVVETAFVELDEGYCEQREECQPGDYVMLSVSDTGTGMDEETQSRIFEPFFTTKDPGHGTGLGLSTVHGIVKQSGGHIFVQSGLGRGTVFKIFLPQSEKTVRPQVATSAAERRGSGGETVLVVEDEEMLRVLIKRTLEAERYKVLLAAQGEEALALIRGKEPIDLLLTDLILPGQIQGSLVAQRALEAWPGLPILCMSGYVREAGTQTGAFDAAITYLEKPFTIAGLRTKVREVLDAR